MRRIGAERAPGRDDGWRRFLLRRELERHKHSALVPSHPTVDIMHGDLECRFTFPVEDGRTPPFLNLPWRRANRQTRPAPYRVLTTDLREDDVVLGGVKKARAALALAVRESRSRELVLLNSACVPDLTGEDVSRLPEGFREGVFHRPSAGQDVAPALVREMLRLAGPGRAKRKAGVNLVGYPGGRALAELVALLEEAGVEVRACLVPNLSPESFRRARGAARNVVSRDRIFEGMVREVLGAAALPRLTPPPPYGLEGTAAWLRAVSPKGWRKAVGARTRPLLERWRTMTREARGLRLGFVLDPGEVGALSDPAANAGVPLVRVLKEMGFGIDYMIHGTRRKTVPGRHRVRFFGSRAELDALIRKSPARAFYSDCFYDRRLSRAGKGQFSLGDFEPGPEGAFRSLERLLDACRLPFYAKYRRWMGGAG